MICRIKVHLEFRHWIESDIWSVSISLVDYRLAQCKLVDIICWLLQCDSNRLLVKSA